MTDPPLSPAVLYHGNALVGRFRLVVRWFRFALTSAGDRDWDFVWNAVRATVRLIAMSCMDLVRPTDVRECNLCGWTGRRFYPNTGPGYDQVDTLCPGCRGIDRHRSLLALLTSRTDFFSSTNRVVEVAPMRGFEAICLAQKRIDYTSFDLERHAMEYGDITSMRFDDASVDYFVCFHVLEHIPDADRALAEIHRVLKRGGTLVLQVPIDWDAERTVEFAGPDRRDVGHVRRYGTDFAAIVTRAGYRTQAVRVADTFDQAVIDRFGLSCEPIFLATSVEQPSNAAG